MTDLKKYQRVSEIAGDSDEDTQLLRAMASEAREYIQRFRWCPPIEEMYLAYGVGKIVAVFLVKFTRKIQRSPDDRLWVVVGDLPSAYMVVEPRDSPRYALERYCELMEQWIDAVKESGDLAGVYPVDAEPNEQNAKTLASRIAFLRSEFLPQAPKKIGETQHAMGGHRGSEKSRRALGNCAPGI